MLGAVVVTEAVARVLVGRLPPPNRRLRTAVIVLGFRSLRRDRANLLQRWRVTSGVATLDGLDDGWLIVSGGMTGRGVETEAALMARYASERLGVPVDRVQLEPDAVSTWENIRFAVPLAIAGGAEQIIIVSDPFHVTRARGFLVRQFPELASIVAGAAPRRAFHHAWLHPALLIDFLAGLTIDAVHRRRGDRAS